MSLKFKEIRKSHNITKTAFAKEMNVSYRTVTNWEKKSGVKPSLPIMRTIGKVLNEPTFKILNSFYNDPDLESQPDDETFIFDNFNFEEPSSLYKNPLTLFKHMSQCKLSNSGFLRFDNDIFNFTKRLLCESDFIWPNTTNDKSDNCIKSMMHPYSAIVLADDNINTIALHESDITKWRIISNCFDNITFELWINKPFSHNMADALSHRKSVPIYLTFKLGNCPESSYSITDCKFVQMDSSKIISTYLKDMRQKAKLTQQEFADKLSIPPYFKVDNKTVAKWEKGTLFPTREQFILIENTFNVSLERLLDAYDNEYFASNSIYKNNKQYNIGLNYTFNNIKTINDLINHFINEFKLVYSAQNQMNTMPLGYIRIFNESYTLIQEGRVLNITAQNDKVLDVEVLSQNTPIKNRLYIQELKPYSSHQNLYYEITGTLIKNSSDLKYFILIFSIFLSK